MFTTRVEISPLQRDSEGKLRGGFGAVMGVDAFDLQGETKVNPYCKNSGCTNAPCVNTGCSNSNCQNNRCTNLPGVIEAPSTTTTRNALYSDAIIQYL